MANAVRRGLVAIFGICAIAWAVDVLLIYRAEASLEGTAQSILSGERFNPAQLSVLKRQLDAAPARLVQASSLSGAAIIRLQLLEDELSAGKGPPSASDIADLQTSVSSALAQSPMDSFMWLTDFWLTRLRGEPIDRNLNLLSMSYWSGPNEGWIAVKRNPLALGAFSSLPGDLAEQAQAEFVGLVRSGLYEDASRIMAGPGWGIHEQLLSRLVQVPEGDRRGFARAMASKDVGEVTVPGLEKRPARPF